MIDNKNSDIWAIKNMSCEGFDKVQRVKIETHL